MGVPHPEPLSGATYSAVELLPGDRAVVVLDQRALPAAERYEILTSVDQVAQAIERLMVRGAPAIGIAAAYGMVLAAAAEPLESDAFLRAMSDARQRLGRTRPTAVNLAWALDKMARSAAAVSGSEPSQRRAHLASEARSIHREDVLACQAIGRLGSARIPDGSAILTHCNAGALATGGYGTALGVVRAARSQGKRVRVIACETRPVLQGARLTAWELARDGIDVTLVTDSMAAPLMSQGKVDLVLVGADRVARSGDVANKIGTYGLACLASLHGLPLYVAAPWSTVDLSCVDGASIPIERRADEEVLTFGGVRIAPEGAKTENPAFDVTPAGLIASIFTERGEARPPCEETLAKLVNSSIPQPASS